jgi:hypothetical protein
MVASLGGAIFGTAGSWMLREARLPRIDRNWTLRAHDVQS